MINTVLGEISENKLGIVSSHEHIFIDMRNCVDIKGNEDKIFYEKFNAENRSEVFSNPYAILDNALMDGMRTTCVRLDMPLGEQKFKLGESVQYTVWVKSSLPICACFGRLDVRQTNMAYYSVEGYSF